MGGVTLRRPTEEVVNVIQPPLPAIHCPNIKRSPYFQLLKYGAVLKSNSSAWCRTLPVARERLFILNCFSTFLAADMTVRATAYSAISLKCEGKAMGTSMTKHILWALFQDMWLILHINSSVGTTSLLMSFTIKILRDDWSWLIEIFKRVVTWSRWHFPALSRRGWRGARLPLSIFNVKEALVTYGNSHLMITKCVKQGET